MRIERTYELDGGCKYVHDENRLRFSLREFSLNVRARISRDRY